MDSRTPRRRLCVNSDALDFDTLEARIEALIADVECRGGGTLRPVAPVVYRPDRPAWWKRWLSRTGLIALLMKHPRLYHQARRCYHRLRR
ncbi:hypothetical protein EQG41_11100 [Billgrantia azerbaijanica]|nr:hypothetical protein EQG41_11100 [Halomonas azerbaijanica]